MLRLRDRTAEESPRWQRYLPVLFSRQAARFYLTGRIEPTTGLHFEDIRVLMSVLQRLVDKGNTVIVIEHNLDVIKMADHIIDMGPEGGRGGGRLLQAGTPEEIVKNTESYTAKYLLDYLDHTLSPPSNGHA